MNIDNYIKVQEVSVFDSIYEFNRWVDDEEASDEIYEWVLIDGILYKRKPQKELFPEPPKELFGKHNSYSEYEEVPDLMENDK
jgi:hypothetical protein